MSERLDERLRRAAQTCRELGKHTTANMFLEAADTICKLLGENARLRELVRDYFNAPCLECNPWAEGWEGCKHCESGNCTLATRTLELGIEADG